MKHYIIKKKYIYLFVLSISLIVSSCESEIDMGDIPIEPRLVINSTLGAANDTCRIYLTESRSIFRPGQGAYWGRDPYTYIIDADVVLSINNKAEKLTYSAKDSAYLYLKPFSVKDNIEIQVSYNNKRLNASAIIPDSPQILSVDTATIYKTSSGTKKKYLKYNLKIKDKGQSDNFYRIRIDGAYHYQSAYWDDFEYWRYITRFRSDDAILNNGNPENTDNDDLSIVTFPPNYYGIFTNTMFKGTEYILKFYVEYPDFLYEDEYDKGYLNVTLQMMSQDLYKYYSSVQRYRYLDEYEMTEPVKIFSNINNGLGIFGAYNEVPVMRLSK
ncbi:hypothetical protein FACS1894179_04420 [Bacteroidia bacterium]|nr:hypothetical protein FACS1894179_04420 [Bacteroidia bacterium]